MGTGAADMLRVVRGADLGPIKERYEDARNAAQYREPTAAENMAFYRGIQWGSAYDFGYVLDFETTGEAREVYNYVGPTVRTAVASMLRAFPRPQVVAAHDSVPGLAKAMATQRLVDSFFRDGTIDFEEAFRGEIDVAVKGACWLKVFFDPNAGRVTQQPRIHWVNGAPHIRVSPETGQPETEPRPEGRIRVVHRDILDVLPDPTATCEEEVGYLFDRKLVPAYRLNDQFPADINGQPPRWTPHQGDRMVSKHLEHIPFWQQRTAKANELCELVEYWERPSPSNQWGGRLVVYQGETVLVDGPLPYDWPWVLRNGQYLIPNGLYADGVVAAIKPMQRSINMNASKKREWIDYILAPNIFVPRGANIERDSITDIAGNIILYDALGGLPQVPTPPSPPAAMFEQEQALVNIIKDVSTYSDVSRGELPQGVETGRALAYLYEFQQGVREPDVRLFHRDYIRVVRLCVHIAREYYAEGRLVRLIGDNNKWQVQAFRRGDFDLEADIEIEVDNGAPNSRALRVAEATQWFQLGVWGSPQTGQDTDAARRFRRYMSLDTAESSTADFEQANRRRALAVIEGFLADPTQDLLAYEQEDHQLFLDELDVFRVSEAYFGLPDFARAKIDDYVYQHEWWLQAQMQNMAQQQAMLTGGAEAEEPEGAEEAGEGPGVESPADGGESESQAMLAPPPADVPATSANGRPPVMAAAQA